MKAPRVSVLMPLWRADLDYLRQAIESLRMQTLEDWEVVVVEDAPFRAAAVLAQFHDRRIVHEERARKTSLAEALNSGLDRCRADLVARFDGDDLCLPDRLAAQVAYLESHPEVAAVGTSLTVIDGAGTVIGHRAMPTTPSAVADAMRRFDAIAHPSVMFRKPVVQGLNGYQNVATEDYDLWCRMIQAGELLANLPDELLRYRFHEGALKFETVHGVIRDTIAVKRRYFRDALTVRDQLRIASERLLLLLPPRLILFLFRWLVYGRPRPGRDPSAVSSCF